MNQELDICNRVYEIATYNMRSVCVTIKKYNVDKPPYIQIRLFTAKGNEGMKQSAYVNYTLNDFKKLSRILGDFMCVDNCKPQLCFVMFFCLVIEILLVQNYFFSLKCTFRARITEEKSDKT